MVKVNISTYGSVNKEVGWNSREVKLEQPRVTVEDVLRAIELGEGRTLLDVVADKRGPKENYAILLNGRSLGNAKDLKKEVKGKDTIAAMDILHPIGGG